MTDDWLMELAREEPETGDLTARQRLAIMRLVRRWYEPDVPYDPRTRAADMKVIAAMQEKERRAAANETGQDAEGADKCRQKPTG